jgi:hypothetical protein
MSGTRTTKSRQNLGQQNHDVTAWVLTCCTLPKHTGRKVKKKLIQYLLPQGTEIQRTDDEVVAAIRILLDERRAAFYKYKGLSITVRYRLGEIGCLTGAMLPTLVPHKHLQFVRAVAGVLNVKLDFLTTWLAPQRSTAWDRTNDDLKCQEFLLVDKYGLPTTGRSCI